MFVTVEERGSTAKRHIRGFVQNPHRARVYALNTAKLVLGALDQTCTQLGSLCPA